MAKSDYVDKRSMDHVLALLTPQNRLVCEIALHTGLRVGDVLALRKEGIKRRMSVKEQKTGKRRVVSLTDSLVKRARGDGASGFVFPGARDPGKPRSRQAVWKDVKRASKALRYKENVSPHSCRKGYAVEYYKRHSLQQTQRTLCHDREVTTMLYALADVISRRG